MGGLVKKAVLIAAALGAVLAGTGVLVVALSFAVYAGLKDLITPAGASAVTALVAAVLALVVGLVLLNLSKGDKAHKPDKHHAKHDQSPLDRAFDLARERPLLAAGGAVAAGILAFRNPALINALVGLGAARAATAPPRR